MYITCQQGILQMRTESDAVAGMTQRKTIAFTMRMDPEVKRAGEHAAANDRRSLAAYIEILMLEDCKRRGLLTPEGRLPPKPKGRRS
jgi:hypothetical protein